MHLMLSDEMTEVLQANLPKIAFRLSALLPKADFHHIGATAIPGALTKGDVDVVLRVDPAEFSIAVSALRSHFLVRQAENWTESFASFGDDLSYPFPLGVQLVIKGSRDDIFLFLREYFISEPAHVAEYNRIKAESVRSGPEEYWKAKNRYLSAILEARENG